ncbi:glycosyltransferase family 2 protein [bacterium]|nr:glycosyltransferase family 2 protein [bacterium]
MKGDVSSRIFVVIPAFNEARAIGPVVRSVREAGFSHIFVVDDGGEDETLHEATRAGAYCLRHGVNRGKGAAVETGIEAARISGAEIVVTMDGDGQHSARDIEKLLAPIMEGKDVCLGVRAFDPKVMPRGKIAANIIANAFIYALYGLSVRDSQSGFRAYGKRALGLIRPDCDGYEYDSRVIGEIERHGLAWAEVPIATLYTAYSNNKKQRQNFLTGVKTACAIAFK